MQTLHDSSFGAETLCAPHGRLIAPRCPPSHTTQHLPARRNRRPCAPGIADSPPPAAFPFAHHPAHSRATQPSKVSPSAQTGLPGGGRGPPRCPRWAIEARRVSVNRKSSGRARSCRHSCCLLRPSVSMACESRLWSSAHITHTAVRARMLASQARFNCIFRRLSYRDDQVPCKARDYSPSECVRPRFPRKSHAARAHASFLGERRMVTRPLPTVIPV